MLNNVESHIHTSTMTMLMVISKSATTSHVLNHIDRHVLSHIESNMLNNVESHIHTSTMTMIMVISKSVTTSHMLNHVENQRVRATGKEKMYMVDMVDMPLRSYVEEIDVIPERVNPVLRKFT
jgi:hypothetical protein